MRDLTDQGIEFLVERHLASLTTVPAQGGLHVVAVGFTWSDGVVRVITSRDSRKVANVLATRHAAVCQVDGPRWLSFSGPANINDDPDAVRAAEDLYARRYRPPRVNPSRVVLEIVADQILGGRGLRR